MPDLCRSTSELTFGNWKDVWSSASKKEKVVGGVWDRGEGITVAVLTIMKPINMNSILSEK